MASPRGITTTAGPGRTTIAKPISKTVKPITATTARLSQVNLIMFFIVGWENPNSPVIVTDSLSPQRTRENITRSSATLIPVWQPDNSKILGA
jgi:hypothetical protein